MSEYFSVYIVLLMELTGLLCNGFEGTCKQGCELEPDIRCSVQEVSCDVIDKDPDFRNKLWPGPPKYLSVTDYVQNSSLRLNVTWKHPPDGGYTFVTGFLVRISESQGISVSRCFYYNLTGTEWNPSTVFDLYFYFDCMNDVRYGQSLFVTLQSVPLPNRDLNPDNSISVYHDTPEEPIDPSKPSDWTTSISFKFIQNEYKNGSTLVVTFQLAPDSMNFDKYIVYLKPGQRKMSVPVNSNDTEKTLNFHDVCEYEKGNYTIKIEPQKKDASGQCVCGGDFFGCDDCRVSVSQEFLIPPHVLCSPPSTSTTQTTVTQTVKTSESSPQMGYNKSNPTDNSDLQIIIPSATLGLLLMVSILVITYFLQKRRKKQQQKAKQQHCNNNESFQEHDNLDKITINGLSFISPSDAKKYEDLNSRIMKQMNDDQSQMYSNRYLTRSVSEENIEDINKADGLPPEDCTIHV